MTYPDAKNSASNALKAAAKAAGGQKTEQAIYNDLPGFSNEEAARIHKAATTNMDRSMYTSAPPVAPEVEEKNRQAGLRAAAISMAKNMMAAHDKAAEMHEHDGETAARASQNKRLSTEADRKEAAMQYLTLQDAAKKLAAERLAKINDESEEYRQYYGAFAPSKSRLSLRARRRSSSDGQLDSDRARSDKIRSEMSTLNSKLSEVDSKKRQTDRDNLLALAQKNVQSNMKGLDEKVFLETGKASPAMKAEWEAQARAKAEKDSKARLENYGKVHIGGGQYMTQAEVDAIAAARVQPTLDEVSRKAEAQRALDEQRRQEEEERKRIAALKAAEERERNKEVKQTWSKFKAEEKERRKEEKEHEKELRDEREVQQIYKATDEERIHKAQQVQEDARRAALEKEERDRQSKVDRSWAQMKEAERREKEEEKARKNQEKQEKRKSRLGSIFGSIAGKDKEKKDETKVKAPEVTKIETVKVDPVSDGSADLETGVAPATSSEAHPAFADDAVAEAMDKIVKHDEDPAFESEERVVAAVTAKPHVQDDNTMLTTVPDIGSSQTEALKPATTPVARSAAPASTPTSKSKAEKDDSRGSWFKRKFSRSAKDEKTAPGTIGKLKRGQEEEKPKPKISNPTVIGSSAIATDTAAETAPVESAASDTVPATAVPGHISAIQRSETDTNSSERDVALAGKEEPAILATSAPTTAPEAESGSVAGDVTPSGSMRGVASAALAASQQLDAQEALRQPEGGTKLSHVDTSATTETSGETFEEARDGLDDLNTSGTGQRVASGGSGGKRDSKFHEEL